MTDRQFFALTPRQFDSLVERKKFERQHQEFMLAQLTAYVVNGSMRAPKEPVAPIDFMPSMQGEKAAKEAAKPKPKKRRLRKVIADELRSTMAYFMPVRNSR